MRRVTKANLRGGIALSCAIVLGSMGEACVGSNGNGNGYTCTGPTSFQVFQPDNPISAIPVCTDAPDEDAGYSGGTLAGAPPLSAEASAQCAVVCAQDPYGGPCCQSAWEPETILCAPQCQ